MTSWDFTVKLFVRTVAVDASLLSVFYAGLHTFILKPALCNLYKR